MARGFSCASMVPCCREVKTSDSAMGVGFAPMAWKAATVMADCGVRMTRLLQSATLVIFLVEVM